MFGSLEADAAALDSEQSARNEQSPIRSASFEAHASASSRRGRPELGRLLSHVRAGNEVAMSSMDRLVRSVITLSQITDELIAKRVAPHFVAEAMAYSPAGSEEYARF